MESPWQRDPSSTARRSTWRSTPLQLPLFVLATITLLLAACGGGTDRPAGAGIYVPVEGTTTTEGLRVETASAQTRAESVQPTADFEQVESLIQSFLDARADVIVGGADPASMAPVALPSAIDFVIGERAYNQQQADLDRAGSTIHQLHTWPNLTAIQQSGEQIFVTDCTERQETNGYGQFNLFFVEHRYSLQLDAGAWKVATVEEVHNGFLERDDRFGCTPQSFTERAEAPAVTMWTEFVALGRNPASTAPLSTAFGDDLAERTAEQAAAQAAAGIALTSNEEVTFRTIGIDTQADLMRLTGDGTTVVVEACRYFPDGLEATDLTTGEIGRGLAPGSELAQWLYVRLSTGPEGRTGPDQVLAVETAPSACGVQQ